MRVTVIAPLKIPYDTKSGGRIHLLCKSLIDKGIDVNVLISKPTENKNNEGPIFIDGIKYFHPFQKSKRSRYFLKRQIDKFLFYIFIFVTVCFRFNKNDVIILFPAFDFRLFIPLLTKISEARVVLEINEYPLVQRKNTIITRIKRMLIFKLSFPVYDGFIVISDELKKIIIKYKSSESIIIKIPIIAKPVERILNSKPPVPYPYLFHAGSLSEDKDGVLGMIEGFGLAIREIEKEVKFIFTGLAKKSVHYNEILDLIKKYNLQNQIIFTGFLSSEELDTYMRHSFLSIINKKDTIQNKYCFASKLAEYLSYSIPVITTNIGESNNYLTDNKNAFLVETENVNKLAEKIIEVFSDSQNRLFVSKNAKNLFDWHFEYSVYRNELLTFLKHLN